MTLDEKAVRRIAHELGTQMLATRTRNLMRFRDGKLPAGTEMADKRVAVQMDGGRVRVRTIVKGSRVGGKRKRRKVRIEWREPKVVIVYELDAQGRMKRGSRPVIDGTLRGPAALIELVAFHLHRLGTSRHGKWSSWPTVRRGFGRVWTGWSPRWELIESVWWRCSTGVTGCIM